MIAGALNVNLVFAAFLAGFAVVHKKRRLFSDALDAIGKVSFAFFIPVYFAIVGLKLDLVHGLSLWMLADFIAGSCIVKILSVSLAGCFAGFRGLDLANLAITTNARAGRVSCWPAWHLMPESSARRSIPHLFSRPCSPRRWRAHGLTMCCAEDGRC